MLQPNLEDARKHLELLDENADEFTFLTFCDDKTKPSAENDVLVRVFNGKFDDLAPTLTKYNQLGAGVFVLVNLTDLKGSKKSNVLKVRSFFAEEDHGMIGDFKLEPTFVVQSKNGKHSYFVLNDFTVNLIQFEKVQKIIASTHGTDMATTNMNRVLRLAGFYHQKDPNQPFLVHILESSTSYYDEKTVVDAYPVCKPKEFKPLPVKAGKKGLLLPKVEEFLLTPWVHGEFQTEFITATANIKKNAYTKNECIELLGKKGTISENKLNQINAIYKSDDYRIEPFFASGIVGDGTIEQLISESSVYKVASVGVEGNGIYIIDKEHGKLLKLNESVVRAVKGKAYKVDEKLCFVDYDPELNQCTYVKDDFLHLNLYEPAKWRSENYFKGVQIIPETKMPIEYVEFFNHMFGNFPESLTYVLDWIAYSLKHKNITVLALVGTKRGIGKSSLAGIVGAMHGKTNFEVCKKTILGKEFNTQMLNKTFVNFDELGISNESELESIKAYTNSITTIEGKGADAKTVRLHANIMLTNNSDDCLNGVRVGDDRQFSVPETNDTPLTAEYYLNPKCGITNTSELWTRSDLIDRLARHLYFRDLSKFDPTKNFKSAHYLKMVKNSVSEWHSFLLEDFRTAHYNCAVKLMDLKCAIKTKEDVKPGRTKLTNICNEYKDKIGVKQIDGVRMMFFAKEDESEINFQTRIEKCSKHDTQGFEFLSQPNPLFKEK